MNKTKDEAVKFYKNFLEMEIKKEFTLDSSLSKSLFSINDNLEIILFAKGCLKIEIMIYKNYKPKNNTVNHICLEIEDINIFIKKCDEFKIQKNFIDLPTKKLYFIKDYSDNIIEVKENKFMEFKPSELYKEPKNNKENKYMEFGDIL